MARSPYPLLRTKFERVRRGWSLADLSARTRIQPKDLSLIERGRLVPTATQLAALANALSYIGERPDILLRPVQVVDEEALTVGAVEP